MSENAELDRIRFQSPWNDRTSKFIVESSLSCRSSAHLFRSPWCGCVEIIIYLVLKVPFGRTRTRHADRLKIVPAHLSVLVPRCKTMALTTYSYNFVAMRTSNAQTVFRNRNKRRWCGSWSDITNSNIQSFWHSLRSKWLLLLLPFAITIVVDVGVDIPTCCNDDEQPNWICCCNSVERNQWKIFRLLHLFFSVCRVNDANDANGVVCVCVAGSMQHYVDDFRLHSNVMNMKLERTAAVNEGNWILNGYVASATILLSSSGSRCASALVCVCVYLCMRAHGTCSICLCARCTLRVCCMRFWKRRQSTKLLMSVHKLRFNCFPLNWNAETIPGLCVVRSQMHVREREWNAR